MLDFLKTNFDGAMLGEVDEAGIGMVICNSLGEVMTALLEKIHKPPSMETSEFFGSASCSEIHSRGWFPTINF